jgi:hypothetical protein
MLVKFECPLDAVLLGIKIPSWDAFAKIGETHIQATHQLGKNHGIPLVVVPTRDEDRTKTSLSGSPLS